MNSFDIAYKNLNPAQKIAVDNIEGTMLVLAGPGTGKTQLLSTRVANIIRKTDASPNNILCLTFTNKAALNMEQRVAELTNGTFGFNIKTFHSFAAEIMNTYPQYFWNGAKLQIAPNAIQLEIIQNILVKLPLDNPLALKFIGQFTGIKDIIEGIKLAKEAGLTPAQLRAIIIANISYIDNIEPLLIDILSPPLSIKKLDDIQHKVESLPPQGLSSKLEPLIDLKTVLVQSLSFAINKDKELDKTTNTGKWKTKLLQNIDHKKEMSNERKRNEWWLHLADVYEKYNSSLRSIGYYDYADMIIEVSAKIESNPNLKADVQEQYQYILIDEFQDTNAGQLRLANLVANSSLDPSNPNLMVVGDDDQSIYKFNGAELNNMLSFERSYPNCIKIVLTENYRSSQKILDTASEVIKKANDRLVLRDTSLSKNLIAHKTNPKIGDISHNIFTTQEEQLSFVAEHIAARRKSPNNNMFTIAVLARGHNSLQQIASILQTKNIPIAYEQQNNILEHQVITQLHTLASMLIAINQGNIQELNRLACITFSHPMWNFSANKLWQIAVDNRHQGNWLDYCLHSDFPEFKLTAKWLLWLAQRSVNQPLSLTIEYLLGLQAGMHLTSPIRNYFINKDTITTDYLHGLSAVRLLLHLTKEYSQLDKSATLKNFVDYVELQKSNEQIVADQSSFISGENPIELLTVHKAKGLEFDEVIIIDAINDNWKPSANRHIGPLNLPLQPPLDNMDDYTRLMFVAMTRAKQHLLVTSYSEDITSKPVIATPLLFNVMPKQINKKQSKFQKINIIEENIIWPQLSNKEAKLVLKDNIENLKLSATGILDFLDVTIGGPNAYLEKHLLRLPSSSSANMAFGSCIHSCLEYAQNLINDDKFDLKKILNHFDLILQRQLLSDNDYNRYQKHGINLLNKLFEEFKMIIPKNSLAELTLNINIGGTHISGTIDRLDIVDNNIVISDYKTGTPINNLLTTSKSKSVKAWRHRTQLTFYALMLQNIKKYQDKNLIGQMIYLEADYKKDLTKSYITTQKDIDKLLKITKIIWALIKDYNLPDITSFDNTYQGILDFEEYLLKKYRKLY